jgi:phenylpyruvate tautomerase PptA (4-oxalocrotonate tautomerase family)
MPYVKIYAKAGRAPQQKRALMEAAHRGMVEGAGIPEWDRQVRLIELGPDDLLLPEHEDADAYVLIEVTGYPRSVDVKRDIYQALVKNLAEVGVDPQATKIAYFDLPPDAWGVQGGIAGSDLTAADTDQSGWRAKY